MPVTAEARILQMLRKLWVLPVDIDRWPLGQQVGAPGPTLPTVRRAGPNELTELLIQPAHR